MELVTFGEAMAQLVPQSGNATDATDFAVHVAGAESNVAVGFARLQGSAAWVSRVGDDPFGRRVMARLAAEGVDTAAVNVDRERPTGCFLKDVTGSKRPVTYYRAGSAASVMSISDVKRALDLAPAMFHTSGVTAALSESCTASLRHVMATASNAGIELSFDVNYRPRLWRNRAAAAIVIRDLAAAADVLFVGRDEAEELWGLSTAEQIRTAFAEVRTVVVKDGAVAATAFRDRLSFTVPAPPVDVVEPVGAGDAFAAGFLRAYLEGWSLEGALKLGHALAGVALRSIDDHGDGTAAAACWTQSSLYREAAGDHSQA
ncbi:sugar kinase [Isoptericola halotolerans]|uniref:sugar kinase n=1 Tax=Isoptericola halotolerans TaxID=300560 RepID=UPI00388E4643